MMLMNLLGVAIVWVTSHRINAGMQVGSMTFLIFYDDSNVIYDSNCYIILIPRAGVY